MLLDYSDKGDLEIVDKEKFNNWLGKNFKQINKLDINNKIVQRVINTYKNKYGINLLHKKLSIYYWTNHSSIEEFELDISSQLDNKNISFL